MVGLKDKFQICLLVAENKLAAGFALPVHVGHLQRIVAEHLDMLNRDR